MTKSRVLRDESRAASTLCASARASLSAARSTTDWDTESRASNTLKGPTMLGTPGNEGPPGEPKPNACRLIFCRVSDTRAFASGSSSLRVFHRTPFARPSPSSAMSTPRLCCKARTMASSTLIVIVSLVAIPVGTPPRNGATDGGIGKNAVTGCWAAAGLAASRIKIRGAAFTELVRFSSRRRLDERALWRAGSMSSETDACDKTIADL